MDPFLLVYLIGIAVGAIIYFILKLIRSSEELNSIVVIVIGLLTIIFSVIFGGWDGMLIATIGAGTITFGIFMFIVWLVKKYIKKTKNGVT